MEELLDILSSIVTRLCVVFNNGLDIDILQKSIAIDGIGIAKGASGVPHKSCSRISTPNILATPQQRIQPPFFFVGLSCPSPAVSPSSPELAETLEIRRFVATATRFPDDKGCSRADWKPLASSVPAGTFA
jgi:hypothetical protein